MSNELVSAWWVIKVLAQMTGNVLSYVIDDCNNEVPLKNYEGLKPNEETKITKLIKSF